MKISDTVKRIITRATGENEDHVRNILIFIIGFTIGAIFFAPYPYSGPALKGFAMILACLFFAAEIGMLIVQLVRKPKKSGDK